MNPKQTAVFAVAASGALGVLPLALHLRSGPVAWAVDGLRILLLAAATSVVLLVLLSTRWIRSFPPSRQCLIVLLAAAGTVTVPFLLPWFLFSLHDLLR